MNLSKLTKSLLIQEYYVIVFDLCSSSIILEQLQEQGNLVIWRKFWTKTFRYLNKISMNGAKCNVYKFIGDGFILIYKPRYEKSILSYCEKIKNYINKKIDVIINTYLTNFSGRMGVTFGIDKGKIIRMRLYGNVEFIGKPINVASRLQALLKLPEHTNKILVTDSVLEAITKQLKDKEINSREEILHNLHGNNKITCYEIGI